MSDLEKLHAEWFLVVRQLEQVRAEYNAKLEELNQATQAVIDPLNAQVQAFSDREKALKEGMLEEYAE